jgi:hypothetical protein
VIAKTGGGSLRFPHSGSNGFALGLAGARGVFVAAALCLAAVLVGLVVVNTGPKGRPRTMVTLSTRTRKKPALSYILFDPANVEELQGEFGRKVLNPAGTDLTTPAVAAQLGLRNYQNA